MKGIRADMLNAMVMMPLIAGYAEDALSEDQRRALEQAAAEADRTGQPVQAAE